MEHLHQAIEAAGVTDFRSRMALHALVACGRITEWTCQIVPCRYPGIPFQAGGHRGKYQVSLDHILPSAKGGSDRPDNLRVAHWGCNSGEAMRGRTWDDSSVAKQIVAVWLRKSRHLQTLSYGVDPTTLEGKELQEFVRTNFLALQVEIAEALQEWPWKPWKDEELTPEAFDRFKEEVADWFFFIGNILVACGITSSELVDAYDKKYEVNELRVLRGVHQSMKVDAKCDQCGSVFNGPHGLAQHKTRKHRTKQLRMEGVDC